MCDTHFDLVFLFPQYSPIVQCCDKVFEPRKPLFHIVCTEIMLTFQSCISFDFFLHFGFGFIRGVPFWSVAQKVLNGIKLYNNESITSEGDRKKASVQPTNHPTHRRYFPPAHQLPIYHVLWDKINATTGTCDVCYKLFPFNNI